jgi:hypothetical protein
LLQNRADHTPVLIFAASMKQFSYGPRPTVRDPVPAPSKIAPTFRHFCNTSPYPPAGKTDSAAMLTTISLSRRYRQQRDPTQHRHEPPPGQMSIREEEPVIKGEVNWIIETKGRKWEGTEEKDLAISQWCERIPVFGDLLEDPLRFDSASVFTCFRIDFGMKPEKGPTRVQ